MYFTSNLHQLAAYFRYWAVVYRLFWRDGGQYFLSNS